MALPKVIAPSFTAVIPSTKKEITFRPFLVKEEKLLLVAMESKDVNHMHRAMVEMLSACILTEGVDVSKLPSFDMEYLFLKIRSKSVSEKAILKYRHVDGVNYNGDSCDAVTTVEINIDDIEVKFDPEHTRDIKLNDKLTIRMKYPILQDVSEMLQPDINETDFIAKCVECVYDSEEVYEPENLNEIKEFIGSLSNSQFADIMKFFDTMPSLQYELTYKCAGCGQVDTVQLKGLADFF